MRVTATTMGAKLHNSAQNANGWDWKSEVSATLRAMTPYATGGVARRRDGVAAGSAGCTGWRKPRAQRRGWHSSCSRHGNRPDGAATRRHTTGRKNVEHLALLQGVYILVTGTDTIQRTFGENDAKEVDGIETLT